MKYIIIAVLISLTVVVPAGAVTYEYDAAGRLVKVVYDNGMETRYTYDLNGNMIGRRTDLVNSVNEEGSAGKAVVAPQPAIDHASIDLDGWEGAKVDVTIVDSRGIVVQRVSRFVQNGTIDVDVRHLPSGAYRASVVNGKAKVTASINVIH